MNQLNLPEFRVLKSETNNYDYRITVEVAKEPNFCIHCMHDSEILGNKPFTKHGIKDREVWDVDMHCKRVKLIIKHRRYKCPSCGGTFYELLDSIPPNGKITTRLYKNIQKQGLKFPFSEVADRYGLSNMTVRRAVDDFIVEHDKGRKLIAPKIIGIDEAHLNQVMRGVITDIGNRKLLEILPDNYKKNIKACIKSMEGYKNIEVATMDMATGYRYAMNELVPNALCIIDKYHVVQCATKALTRIRVDYKKSLPIEERRLFMNDKYVLESNKENLSPKDIDKRNMWFARHTPLMIAYWLKEGLRDIYLAKDRYEAYQIYYTWESAIPNELRAFREVADTINNCKQEVFNYFLTETKYTNAYTESINNQIKRVEKDGIGYSFPILRAKCLYGSQENEKPDFGENSFWDIDLAPCSSNPIARFRRKIKRITTFVKKLLGRKP